MTRGEVRARALLLAGVLLGAAGIFDAVAAGADLTGDRYVSFGDGVVHRHDITGWVWLRLAAGVGVALAGALVPLGRRWSGLLALAAVAVFVVLHLFLFTYHPVQTVLVLGPALAAARLILLHRASPAP
ncbi:MULTISPECIES: hypothetical protein [unclassified Micromonospora]|uniref:DUF7144 family membrane protein n=1 Tax=unclassified Micromonospora TaxID=2617518 RepID=UPI001033EEAB|nr:MULTISPECIES: hypothetical protein [unclassified Micromonospora]QKW14013.1 hypothetical protein HUT12_15260 [Verrucosispora sp. NA02020]TBL39520.1 hypothetical protein EYA84_08270 [Verrucosispora sp. SN26_14.1]